MTNITQLIIDYNLIDKFEIDYLKLNGFAPIKEEALFILVISINENPNLSQLINKTNKLVKIVKTKEKKFHQLLHLFDIKKKLYNFSLLSTQKENLDDSFIDKFLNLLITTSLKLKSSDIHIETNAENFIIRMRIDGELKHLITLHKSFNNILSSYIKLQSNLDISLKRIPQNSRFSFFIENKKYDFRVSTMPTIEGESIVLRILENSILEKDLSKLGFDDDTYESIKRNIIKSSGLILITGPTGSGKTTTLYSIIKELNNTNKKIITIEDPVEYKIAKVQQIPINNNIGLTFNKVLKNILRQDPDIILIGEIRDKESLKIAIQASLTGHLVFATLHTNSALNTINRVLDLDGEPFLLATTLKSILSQRLVRKLCDNCKKFDKNTKQYIASGCERCNYDGFKGRTILYEMINIDEHISNMIASKKNTYHILNYLNKNKYTDIKNYSNILIKKGITTKEEIYKVI